MKLVREHIFEVFSEDSDPVNDMGIGGFAYEILKPGAIIAPKKYMRFGTNTGTLVSKGGNMVRPGYYLLVIDVRTSYQVKGEGKDRYFTCLAYGSEKDAQEYREKFKKREINNLLKRTWVTKIKINIKKQAFNNRFQIIERGF
jgi:hypothetical protein